MCLGNIKNFEKISKKSSFQENLKTNKYDLNIEQKKLLTFLQKQITNLMYQFC